MRNPMDGQRLQGMLTQLPSEEAISSVSQESTSATIGATASDKELASLRV
jgi:hypothetical protein